MGVLTDLMGIPKKSGDKGDGGKTPQRATDIASKISSMRKTYENRKKASDSKRSESKYSD